MRPTESTRSLPAAFLVVAALLLVARAGTAYWEGKHPPEVSEKLHWLTPAEADASARRFRRPLLYEFTADWCMPCQRLKREVFSDQGLAAQVQAMFAPARVLDRQREEGRNSAEVDSLERHFGVEGFPTLVVVTPEGKEVGRIYGYPGSYAVMDSLRTFYRRSIAERMTTLPGQGPTFGTP